MTNRQARIRRLKAAFQKAEELMKAGYVVQWDGEVVTRFDWTYGLTLFFNDSFHTHIYDDLIEDDLTDYADMSDEFLESVLLNRLTVWKRMEIKL